MILLARASLQTASSKVIMLDALWKMELESTWSLDKSGETARTSVVSRKSGETCFHRASVFSHLNSAGRGT